MQDLRRHGELFGELQSINQAVAQLSTIGVSLDTIIELLKQPALRRADCSDRGPGPNSPTTTVPLVAHLDADEHNQRARLYNSLGEDGDFVLMPLWDHSNCVVTGFPRTLGQLAHFPGDSSADVQLIKLLKCFRLTPDPLLEHHQFCEFVGVNFGTLLHVHATYNLPLPRPVADLREQRESLRNSTVSFAAPPTRTTQCSIERLNTLARAENRITLFTLRPLRDIWGLVVPSFPKDLFQLFNQDCGERLFQAGREVCVR
ncbi:hypothetical protein Q9L58_009365 [Maublancomyces gigas]|uniref:Uncharacterized protein n=1 Tax=Discina gigas TaxID=1032678 RepID=A0ABR3G773_9PEZI